MRNVSPDVADSTDVDAALRQIYPEVSLLRKRPRPDEPPNAMLIYTILDFRDQNLLDMSTWMNAETGEGIISPDGEPTACGTTACVAGWAAVLNGWSINAAGCAARDRASLLTGNAHPRTFSRRAGESADIWPIDDLGRELLNLTPYEADRLFFCSNEALDGVVKDIFGADPRPEPTI